MVLKERFVNGLKHYFFNVVLIWLAILFYNSNKYYVDFLRDETQITILYLAFAYTLFGILFYILIPIERHDSKGFILFKAFRRIFRDVKIYLRSFTSDPRYPLPRIEKYEKTAMLFLLVKLFFLPIMLNFFFSNYFGFIARYGSLPSFGSLFTLGVFNTIVFPLLVSFIFMVDTLYFSFGYAFEAGFLRNKLRSVEPTILGWVVALISYPPFNNLASKYVSWYPNDFLVLSSELNTFILRAFLVLFLLIYLSATLALGTKCSNLTNRGIVSRGPYRFVRHPAYISKNMFWLLTVIPLMNLAAFASVFFWTFIYYLRAITEERHLIQDPDYQEYCKKVRYRFVPGVW